MSSGTTGEANASPVFVSALAAQRQLGLEHKLPVDTRGGGGLNQFAKSSGNTRFDADDLARFRGAEDFHAAHRREFEVKHRRNLRVALRHSTGELRSGFDKQHAWHQWLAG